MRALMHLLLVPVLAVALAAPAAAQRVAPAALEALFKAMGLPETVEIMREEGFDYAAELDRQLLDGRGGDGWMQVAGGIYDGARMAASLRDTLSRELAGADLDPMIAFFDSARGRRIVALEISARRAFLDGDVEAAAREAVAGMANTDDPRLASIRRFVEINDLVAANVVGALNSNFAFYSGMAEGGAFPQTPGEADILADVWGQEAAIRADTQEWVYAYLAMAYRPLTDADLDAYIGFSRSVEGQALNRAVFAAFDVMFVDISRELGLAAARFMQGEDI